MVPEYYIKKSQKREDLQQNCPNIYLVLPEYWEFSNFRGGGQLRPCPPVSYAHEYHRFDPQIHEKSLFSITVQNRTEIDI